MISETHTKHANLEVTRIREIARELELKGYEIIREPSRDELPTFLSEYSYRPDLLAISEDEKLVVEVKSRPSVRGDTQISKIADRVNSEPNWRFLFVYSNPRSKQSESSEYVESDSYVLLDHLREGEQKIARLAGPTDKRAYLLYFWGLLEASLRAGIMQSDGNKQPSSSYTLVRNARIEGLISAEQFHDLRRLQQQRNLISHGHLDTQVNIQDLRLLVEVSEAVINEAQR